MSNRLRPVVRRIFSFESTWKHVPDSLEGIYQTNLFKNGFASKSRSKVRKLVRANERKGLQRQVYGVNRIEEAPESALTLVNRSSLIVTRDVEWGQVLLGYEQANKYSIRDETGQVVALLAEEHGGLGRVFMRQLFRTRRGFTATVFNSTGSEILFKLRRPPYLISSTMLIEDADDAVIGEVQQEWHLLRRRYNLFIDRTQFARIDAPILAWEFLMTDESGSPLALIDRNFSGFGKEIFTDAGKYAIHFGETPRQASQFIQRSLDNAYPEQTLKAPEAALSPDTKAVIPCTSGNQLLVKSPLQVDERMVALAAAISIDYDYFSRHSYGSGILSPMIHPPMPMPMPIPSASADQESVPPGDGPATANQDETAPQRPWEEYDDLARGKDDGSEEWGDDNDFGHSSNDLYEEYDDFGQALPDEEPEDSSSIFDLFDWGDD
ncbi:hypothetical protein M9435_000548 [Picochlorum sp. BPE23]|nr:hypothetical protein M9435_000548 [Picochlorum sp. BPE23]